MNLILKNLIDRKISYAIITLSVGLYVVIANLVNRTQTTIFNGNTEFYILVGSVLLLLLLNIALFQVKHSNPPTEKIIITALLFRLPFLFIIPNLSDDFYRFIWDGMLWKEGISPYTVLPKNFIVDGIHAVSDKTYFRYLFERMNSQEYYTIYPALPQLIFYAAAVLGGDQVFYGVLVMRVLVIIIETVGFVYLIKLLKYFNINRKYALLYVLNPLLVIESAGNLHHEGMMVSFLIISIYFLASKKNLFLSACFLALSIATKLLPLMLLPLFLRQLGFNKFVKYILRLSLFLVLLFVPLLISKSFLNFFSSVDLYFQRFEFNASIYYLLRYLGELKLGYNPIQVLAPVLSIVSTMIILTIAYKTKPKRWESFFQSALGCFSVYYLFAAIVHPWYIINLLYFCIFTRYRFPLIWSVTAFFSYATYLSKSYEEQLTLTAIEYVMVFLWLFYERHNFKEGKKKRNKIIQLNRDN